METTSESRASLGLGLDSLLANAILCHSMGRVPEPTIVVHANVWGALKGKAY